jgi:hypothetical protein
MKNNVINSWLKTKYLVFNQEKYEKDKQFNEDLGIDAEVKREHRWLNISIDLSSIKAFGEYLIDEEPNPFCTIVYMQNTEVVINIPYSDFEILLNS